MSASDLRSHLARPDLAAADLEGVVAAERYATPEPFELVRPSAALRRAPDPAAEQLDQLLLGERFDALEAAGDFVWGQARRDGYVGFVEAAALAPAQTPPTHWVRALRTFAFAEPSIKAPALGPFSLNALVAVVGGEGDFLKDAAGRWFWRHHLAAIGQFETDPAAICERFVGTPYLWGGRDSLGVDCSGLVQQALFACGLACPRDSDQQAVMGREIEPGRIVRGDLVFWRGHVGMMLDGARFIHANAHHMAVAIETLNEACARIDSKGNGLPTAYRRLNSADA
jgi:cell wall-associated NlpC family hydrolase